LAACRGNNSVIYYNMKKVHNKIEKNIMEKEFVCNRMPICAVAGYVIAKRAKYNDNLSKSLGMALATKLAIWKNAGWGYGVSTNKHYGAGRVSEQQLSNEDKLNAGLVDEIDFCGENFLVKDNLVVGELHVKKEFNCSPDKFDFQVHKIESGGGNFKKLVEAINEKLDSEEWKNYDLSKAVFGKSFMRFWKQIRDDFRKTEFYHE